jgi:DNA-binding response OmpR family regulator
MPNRKNKVVLLVEPEQRLSPLKLVLETEQYNVLTATDPERAHELISRFAVDAVLIDGDAKPEHYNCASVVSGMKKSRPEIPVIILSSRYWTSPDACDGADYLVAKGNSPVEMIRAIEKILGDPQPEVSVTTGNHRELSRR